MKEIANRAAAGAERQAIRLALLVTRGDTSEAARLLQVDDKTLHVKIKRYDIEPGLLESNIAQARASSSGDHLPGSLIN